MASYSVQQPTLENVTNFNRVKLLCRHGEISSNPGPEGLLPKHLCRRRSRLIHQLED